ncbi:capsule assembly Wzi family protein [Limnohabitans sp. DM1]|uniref:capsule assembly Wzi family protein n=1 Tax=Limnohabitans sp. DM1 TaxID=1597955 RepID=UPI000ADA4597|nr:capsule assembly Wzi family protein [Limnohabitans sp. DM1]
MKNALVALFWALLLAMAQAQTQPQRPMDMAASVPYTPSWTARHHLQWLVDHAGLQITTSHWPLPAAAVELSLAQMVFKGEGPKGSSWGDGALTDIQAAELARAFVLKELQALRSSGRMQLHVRSESEALNGYGENYTPGTSAQISTAEGRQAWGDLSVAGRLGARLEASPNSLQTQFRGMGTEGRYAFKPEGSAAVLGFAGWNVQAFSHRFWWGPGWQSSMVNGHNNPAWSGVGVQRGSVLPSVSPWLSWMGPWNLDVFVAKAQDPLVVANQPTGFLFSGMRLTLKPQPWLEVGLSRGLQTGGKGRQGGLSNFVKAMLGQQVNASAQDSFVDSSGQIAGFDVRLSCPPSWGLWLGSCAAYTQWMGEDAAGKIPLPYKFMTLWGVESTVGQGRHRVFAEWANANAYSLPWDKKQAFPGYVNGVYGQGYTQGARWVGPAQGAGSRVVTLGWMDADSQRQLKVHKGRINTSLGAYDPRVNAPRGDVWGIGASQVLTWKGMTWTPELAYTELSEGLDQRASKLKNWRVGLQMSVPFY